MTKMMKKFNAIIACIHLNNFFRVLLILGCCCIFSCFPSFAQDTFPKKELPQQVPKESVSNTNNVYKNPTYFSNVPVGKAAADSLSEKKSFEKIHSHYHSSEFNYQEDRSNRLSWWDRLSRRINDFLNSLLPKLQWDLSNVFYYAFIGIGLAVLIYVIYRLTTSGKKPGFREEREEDNATPDWMEKKLTELNLQTYLDQALSDKNYMLAIRYLYLINLQKLAATGQIDWHYQKTNHEFLWELKNRELRADFAQTIRIYEYIWFGKFAIAENKFGEYQQLFHHFNQKIA